MNLSSNEDLLNNLFYTIINDHFLFKSNTNLDSLTQIHPLFTSIFVIITLNTIIKTNLKFKNIIVSNFLKTLDSCLKINYQLPVLVYNQKIITTSMNPFHGILYLTILYPLELDLYDDDLKCNVIEKNNIYEIIQNLHLICLKLVQELNNKKDQSLKILTLNHILYIESFFNNYFKISENNTNLALFDESLDKLAQILQICLKKEALQFNKFDIKNLFEKYVKLVNNELFMLLF